MRRPILWISFRAVTQMLPNDTIEMLIAATDAVKTARASVLLAGEQVLSAQRQHETAVAAQAKAEADLAALVHEAAEGAAIQALLRAAQAQEEPIPAPANDASEMPIVAKEEFMTGHHTVRVVAFLNANPTRFFTAAEMARYVGVANMDSLRTTLANLAADGEIVRGDVKGQYGATSLAKAQKEEAQSAED